MNTLFFNGVGVLIAVVLIVASFFSKTMVFGRIFGGEPQKTTRFGRVWMFLAGLTGVCGFGLPILKQLHVASNPASVDIGQSLSEVVLFMLFLSMVIPLLIVSVRDLWLKRNEETRVHRIISICLALIFLYLIWEATPAIMRKVLTLFHNLSTARAG
jgi:hypothetical protein